MPEIARSRWDDEIRRRLEPAGFDPVCERDVAREIAQHLEDRYAELRAAGCPREEAERQVFAELNEEEFMRRELSASQPRRRDAIVLGETRRRPIFGDVWQDVRYAIRVLQGAPGFTAVAVLTLALGIGATAAIFSVIDALLIRPIVYDPAGRLVTVHESRQTRGPDGPETLTGLTPSMPLFSEWIRRSTAFDASGQTKEQRLTLIEASPVERVSGRAVTPGFFDLFGARPLLGRTFVDSDDHQLVTVLSYGCWQRRFGASEHILGRAVRMLEGTRTIIGVLPPDFGFDVSTDFWIPLKPTPTLMKISGWGGTSYARLKAQVSIAGAQTDMNRVLQQLQAEGLMSARAGIVVTSNRDWTVRSSEAAMLRLLMAIVGFVLLIGCVNVAGLLTARGAGRTREVAIRAALGASGSRLVRQLLTESLVLALLGGVSGVLLAYWTLGFLLVRLPVSVPPEMPAAIDLRVLSFTAALSCVTGVLFGLWPSLRLARAAADAVRSGSPALQASGRGGRVLVAVQIAVALVLLVSAGLMVRSLQQLLRIDPGFDPQQVLVAEASPVDAADGQGTRAKQFYREVIDRIAELPGVQALGAINTLPFWSTSHSSARVEGRDSQISVSPRYVLPGYFEAMNIRVKHGRVFTPIDDERAPCVAVVNEQAARQHWQDGSPLGRRVLYDASRGGYGKSGWCEIVGIVGDVRHESLEEPVLPELYFSAMQADVPELAIIVRTPNPDALVPAVRAQLATFSSRVLIARVVPFEELIARSTAERRQRAILLSLLGGLGVLLACIGIFGLTGYTVARRTAEIGIRMALGATPWRVLTAVMTGFGTAIAWGLVLGLFGAWSASRLIARYLFQVGPMDPLTIGGVSTLLVAAALTACYLPARRALRVDPVVALRAE